MKEVAQLQCKNCGKNTTRWGSRTKKYCSLQCKIAFERSNKAKHYPEIGCEVCHTIFKPVSKRNKYCCGRCKVIADTMKRSEKPKLKECSHCKNQFAPYTSLDKFCSFNCRTMAMKSKRKFNWNPESAKKRTGINNPGYRHGLRIIGRRSLNVGERVFLKSKNEYKRLLFEKHGYLYCEKCGKTKVKLESHHIIYRSEKPNHEHLHSLRNIILVCVKCHNWFHNSKGNRDYLVELRGLGELFGNDVLNKTKQISA